MPPACADHGIRLGPKEIWDRELSDAHLLEMLLSTAVPQETAHGLARRLLEGFGDLRSLLDADPDRLARHAALEAEAIHQIKLVQAIALRLGRIRMTQQLRLGCFDAVVEYLRMRFGHSQVEQLWALFLNSKHGLIADEELTRGTIDHTPAYPREIVKRALELGAAGMVLVHNHPSGDPTPSARDIALTMKVHAALATVDIRLHDHIIITAQNEVSLSALGLFA